MKRAATTEKLHLGIIGTGWPGQIKPDPVFDVEDAAFAFIRFENGAVVHLETCNAEQALQLMEMLDAIYASSTLSREVPIA